MKNLHKNHKIDKTEYDFDKFSPSQPIEVISMNKKKIINAVLKEANLMKDVLYDLLKLGYSQKEVMNMPLDQIEQIWKNKIKKSK